MKTKVERYYKSGITDCSVYMRPVLDVSDIISGKWRLPLIMSLSDRAYRFSDLKKHLDGITPKMLSTILFDLETNGIITKIEVELKDKRHVQYQLTAYGKSIDQEIIVPMRKWGLKHRNFIKNL